MGDDNPGCHRPEYHHDDADAGDPSNSARPHSDHCDYVWPFDRICGPRRNSGGAALHRTQRCQQAGISADCRADDRGADRRWADGRLADRYSACSGPDRGQWARRCDYSIRCAMAWNHHSVRLHHFARIALLVSGPARLELAEGCDGGRFGKWSCLHGCRCARRMADRAQRCWSSSFCIPSTQRRSS